MRNSICTTLFSVIISILPHISAHAAALIDPAVYAPKNGLTCENLWLYSQFIPTGEWVDIPEGKVQVLGNFNAANLPFAESSYARMATICGDKVYVANSSRNDLPEGVNDRACYYIFDLYTGEYEKTVYPTYKGEFIENRILSCNSIGADDYGHLWFAPYRASLAVTNEETHEVKFYPAEIYYLTDPETGVCEKIELYLDNDHPDKSSRIDYFDVVGDLTGEEANTVIMACGNGDETLVYGWRREQGGDEFENHFGRYNFITPSETYPADETVWGTAPIVYICRDEDSTGELFYTDGFTTCPTLYNVDSEMLDGFFNATELSPKTGTNGICEFNIAGKYFIAYSLNQYIAPEYCMVGIAQLGEGMSFDGFEPYWQVPQGGMGDVSDGGSRVHSLSVKKKVDSNGKEAVYLLNYKCRNGFGVYRIAEEGYNENKILNKLAVEDTTVFKNSEFSLSVSLKNENEISSLQCDIVIPKGLTVKDDDGYPDITIGNRAPRKCNFSAYYISNDTVRVVCNANKAFSGNDGELFTIKFNGYSELGKLYVSIVNIELTEPSLIVHRAPDVTCSIDVLTTLGDINGDGMITADDIICVCKYLLYNQTAGINATSTDVNADGETTISDIVLLAQMISSSSPVTAPGTPENESNSLAMEGGEIYCGSPFTMSVEMNNNNQITAFQCDLVIPEGLNIKTNNNEPCISLTNRAAASHTLMMSYVDQNKIRLICYSTDLAEFSGKIGDLFTILFDRSSTDGTYELMLTNIELSDTSAARHKIDDITCVIDVMPYYSGDANGDGMITVTDIVYICNYILKTPMPSEFVFDAADANNDGNITVTDVVFTENIVLSVSAISNN